MTTASRWQSAQAAESEFWQGTAADDRMVSRVLEANREIAARIKDWVPAPHTDILEIGVGGLGVGTVGFLSSFPVRVGLDPLPPPPLSCGDALRQSVLELRRSVQLMVGQGESMPFADDSFGVVVCSNVLDHVREPQAVIREARRVLRPAGFLYLEVDVFSLAGIVKWRSWTRFRHSKEILVRAHPARFREPDLVKLLEATGFEIVKSSGSSLGARILGHSWQAAFLARKPEPLRKGSARV